MVSVASWYMYLSLTLRNTWLNFILDRYFHYLLFYAMFLPTNNVWSWDASSSRNTSTSTSRTSTKEAAQGKNTNNETIVTLATIALKCQVFWIYLDAGQGKYNDVLGGWSLAADPLPALDTYARHTVSLFCYVIRIALYDNGLIHAYTNHSILYEVGCSTIHVCVAYARRPETHDAYRRICRITRLPYYTTSHLFW
jgi:hypothetical protein